MLYMYISNNGYKYHAPIKPMLYYLQCSRQHDWQPHPQATQEVQDATSDIHQG